MLRGALGRPVLTLNDEGAPFITRFDSYSLTYATQQFRQGIEVARYNRPGAADLCVYSDAYPFDVTAPAGSVFIRAQGVLVHGIYPTSITYGKVERIDVIASATRMTTAPGKLLIRFTGPEAQRLSQIHFINQPISLIPRIEGPLWGGEMVDAVGGSDILLSDGQVPAGLRDDERLGRDNQRDARTAVGYSAQHEKIFLVVVEGRHAGSVGMTLSELARFLAREKVWHAMNLDGGGSSGLWLAGRGMVNQPEGARPLNNALVVVREAPAP